MDMIQVLTLIGVAIANIGTTITLFLWSTNRAEENRKEGNHLIQCIRDDMKDFQNKYLQETKDFHGRLCAIEERNKGK
jgi:hypothetical protein